MTVDPLGPAWFAAVARRLDGEAPASGPVERIGHAWPGPDGVPVHHVQAFAGGRLRDWYPVADLEELLAAKDLLIVAWDQPADEYLASLLGAPIALPEAPERRTDVLGVAPGLTRAVGPVPAEGLAVTVAVRVEVAGRVWTVHLDVDGETIRPGDSGRRPSVEVTAPYERIVAWLHDEPTLLGHLAIAGHHIGGDIGHLSAVEGVVSAPPERNNGRWEAAFLAAVTRYVALTTSPAHLALRQELGV